MIWKHFSSTHSILGFSQFCTAAVRVRIARGMSDCIVPRYQLYTDPLVCHFHLTRSYFATTFMELEFLTFFICVWNNFFSPLIVFFFFHFVQLSIVMQPLLSPPQPPFPDLPEFLSGIITFFQDFFQQSFQDFSKESSHSFRISFKHSFKISLRDHCFLSGFLSNIPSGFLWEIITFFRVSFNNFLRISLRNHHFFSGLFSTILSRFC